ncbi:MAG: OadG family protein [Lachnospiraceae bacterium]|nr:OadG family protein [Lachnospiraceae bacterium]
MTTLSLLAGGIAGWWASIEDAMAEATVNTIIGITVVFLALLFISFVISLFKYINKFEQKLAEKKAGKAPAPKAEPAPAPAPVTEAAPEMDDLELIAVITAAIHAYEEAQGNVVEGDLVVRSIKKRNSRWQNA